VQRQSNAQTNNKYPIHCRSANAITDGKTHSPARSPFHQRLWRESNYRCPTVKPTCTAQASVQHACTDDVNRQRTHLQTVKPYAKAHLSCLPCYHSSSTHRHSWAGRRRRQSDAVALKEPDRFLTSTIAMSHWYGIPDANHSLARMLPGSIPSHEFYRAAVKRIESVENYYCSYCTDSKAMAARKPMLRQTRQVPEPSTLSNCASRVSVV
jgi:hypothetical protein